MNGHHTLLGGTARQSIGEPRKRGRRAVSLTLGCLALVSMIGCSVDSGQDGERVSAEASAETQASGEINPDWAEPILSMQSSSLERVAQEWAESECTGPSVAAAETKCAGIATRDALLANQTLARVNELLAKDQPVESLLPIAQEAQAATKAFFAHFCDRKTAEPECAEATDQVLDVLASYKKEVDRLLA